MPALATVAIGAIGAIGSAKIQANSQKRALAAQTKSTDDALAFQKDQMAQQRADKQAAAANWQRQYDAYLQQYYGYKPPGGGAPAPAAASGMGGPAQVPVRAGGSFADILGGSQNQQTPPLVPQGQNMADLAGWNDWRNYGLSA